MIIQSTSTPNPNSMQFFPGQVLVEGETFFFREGDDLSNSPLAERLLVLKEVQSLFIGYDFITITKQDTANWEDLKPLILAELYTHLIEDKAIVIQQHNTQHALKEDPESIDADIRAIIDEKIRPTVAMDGGDILFDKFENGIVYVRLQGACVGCPSSMLTLKQGVERILCHYVPDVVGVEAI